MLRTRLGKRATVVVPMLLAGRIEHSKRICQLQTLSYPLQEALRGGVEATIQATAFHEFQFQLGEGHTRGVTFQHLSLQILGPRHFEGYSGAATGNAAPAFDFAVPVTARVTIQTHENDLLKVRNDVVAQRTHVGFGVYRSAVGTGSVGKLENVLSLVLSSKQSIAVVVAAAIAVYFSFDRVST